MSDNIIEINEEKVKEHSGEFFRETVEEILNAMLDAEADAICHAQIDARLRHITTTK